MEDLVISHRLTIPAAELETTFVRSGGPGGQNVNKVNSKVTLRWQIRDNPLISDDWRSRVLASFGNRVNSVGELVLHSQKYRAQPKNIDDCREKLKSLLLECQSPPTLRRPSRPTLGSKKRRLDEKNRQGQKKRLRGQVGFD